MFINDYLRITNYKPHCIRILIKLALETIRVNDWDYSSDFLHRETRYIYKFETLLNKRCTKTSRHVNTNDTHSLETLNAQPLEGGFETSINNNLNHCIVCTCSIITALITAQNAIKLRDRIQMSVSMEWLIIIMKMQSQQRMRKAKKMVNSIGFLLD